MKPLYYDKLTDSHRLKLEATEVGFGLCEDVRCLKEDIAQLTKLLDEAYTALSHAYDNHPVLEDIEVRRNHVHP